MLGYASPLHLIGTDLGDIVDPEDREMVMSRGAQRMKGERPPDYYEFRMIGADRTHLIQVRSIPVLYAGQPGGPDDCPRHLRAKGDRRPAKDDPVAPRSNAGGDRGRHLHRGPPGQHHQLQPAVPGADGHHGGIARGARPGPPAVPRGHCAIDEQPGRLQSRAWPASTRTSTRRATTSSSSSMGVPSSAYTFPQKVGGQTVGIVWSLRDITQRRRLEALASAPRNA